MSNVISAKELEKPILEKQVLIKTSGDASIRPLIAVQSNDNGFIIAGTNGLSGWATKIDSEGKVIWNYFTNSKDGTKFYPEFRSAVSMPDGSTFLCGKIPNPSGNQGLLVHLDTNGHLLNEKHITPSKVSISNNVAGGNFESCIRWKDGIAVIGYGGRLLRMSEQGIPESENFYWIILADNYGNILLEKEIPVLTQYLVPNIGGLKLLKYKSGLIISATDNNNTEILSLNNKIEVYARKQLIGGRFFLVYPIEDNDEKIELFGSFSPTSSDKSISIMLNNSLEEIQRHEGYPKGDLIAEIAYRLSDQSLVLFGAGIHSFGEKYRTEVAHLDASLSNEKKIEVCHDKTVYLAFNWAVTRSSNDGKFITATSAYAQGLDNNHPERFGVLPNFKRGFALDFVNFK